MNAFASLPLCIQRASPDERLAALELVFGRLSPANRDRRVAQVLAAAKQQGNAVLWVGYRGQQLAAAMLAEVQVGRTAFVTPPRLIDDEPHGTASDLSVRVMDDLLGHGVQLAQALLETDHGPDAEQLLDVGFRHVANLLYLVSLAGSFPTSPPQDGLEFVPYRPAEQVRLANVMQRTYEASLDCPAIDKVRTIDDVLEGYRATGVFDPARWLIAMHQGIDIGCVLLTDHPHSNQCELIYMGLVREARGRGWGVALRDMRSGLRGRPVENDWYWQSTRLTHRRSPRTRRGDLWRGTIAAYFYGAFERRDRNVAAICRATSERLRVLTHDWPIAFFRAAAPSAATLGFVATCSHLQNARGGELNAEQTNFARTAHDRKKIFGCAPLRSAGNFSTICKPSLP